MIMKGLRRAGDGAAMELFSRAGQQASCDELRTHPLQVLVDHLSGDKDEDLLTRFLDGHMLLAPRAGDSVGRGYGPAESKSGETAVEHICVAAECSGRSSRGRSLSTYIQRHNQR